MIVLIEKQKLLIFFEHRVGETLYPSKSIVLYQLIPPVRIGRSEQSKFLQLRPVVYKDFKILEVFQY